MGFIDLSIVLQRFCQVLEKAIAKPKVPRYFFALTRCRNLQPNTTKMKKVILFLVAIFIANSAFSQSDSTNDLTPKWIPIVAAQMQGSKWYYRSDAVSQNEDGVKIWVKNDRDVLEWYGKKYKHVSREDLTIMDCSRRRMFILTTIIYNSKGSAVASHMDTKDTGKWLDVVPDTISEAILNIACKEFTK